MEKISTTNEQSRHEVYTDLEQHKRQPIDYLFFFKELEDLANAHSNDSELGEAVRKYLKSKEL